VDAGPAARRQSRQPPHPRPGAGRQPPGGSSSAGRVASRCAMASSTSPTPNRTASRRTPAGWRQ